MQKKPSKTPYEELREYIDDYIIHLEKINKERLKAAEKELKYTQMESIAFNLLRQNIANLEVNNGVS
jgi:hypothetical protein